MFRLPFIRLFFLGNLFLIGVFFATPTSIVHAASASLYIDPPQGTFTIGSTFTVSIFLNTGGQSVNAVKANISFPPDKLQVVSPTAGKSFIQIWVNQPNYSNVEGTLNFQGAVPTPGINTASGLISTVTFRVKSLGRAAIKILDTSSVLLNDGKGTDALGSVTSGIYELILPPPEGPTVTSRTNPDQSKWYSGKNASFEWASTPDVQGFSYILDQDPVGEPDDISEGGKTGVSYTNLSDGVYYFHIKALRQNAWGGSTNYAIKIDSSPPASFAINFSPSRRTSNHRPIIDFSTTDAISGVDHYELKIIPLDAPAAQTDSGNKTPFFIESVPPYSPTLDNGRYKVVVRAYDGAGNYYQSEDTLSIVKPLFELIYKEGLRLGGAYTISWFTVSILSLLLLLLLFYILRTLWRWHRQLEKHIEAGVLKHPAVVEKVAELEKKRKEYSSKKKDKDWAKAFFLGIALTMMCIGSNTAHAQQISPNLPISPSIITLFPATISNDEILYIGGRAEAPNATVFIYLQQIETGNTVKEVATTDQDGAWFYSFPRFLNGGNYLVWTQLKVGENLSPPSPQKNLTVATTAVQIGKNRISYENFYFVFLVIFFSISVTLVGFIIYHGIHVRNKKRRLESAIREAHESIRRGFALLRQDIQSEINLLHTAKLNSELSSEERLREEKLLRDFDEVNRYVGEEVWKIEKLERES